MPSPIKLRYSILFYLGVTLSSAGNWMTYAVEQAALSTHIFYQCWILIAALNYWAMSELSKMLVDK